MTRRASSIVSPGLTYLGFRFKASWTGEPFKGAFKGFYDKVFFLTIEGL